VRGRGHYIHIVFEFHASGAIQLHILQGRAHHIVRLALGLLRSFDRGGLVQIAPVFDIKPVERILERKDRALVKLWKAPVSNPIPRISTYLQLEGATLLLKLEGIHLVDEYPDATRSGKHPNNSRDLDK
jgi:hypothetical protein